MLAQLPSRGVHPITIVEALLGDIVVAAHTVERRPDVFGFLSFDDIGDVDQPIVPGRLRQHESVGTDRLNDIRHVAHGHRGNDLRVQIGLSDDGQVHLVAGLSFIGCDRGF
jgi:hypothetical protein